ncbi:unnamed protein product [Adineta ricciae]|uniref:Uncharacterized protein n=1 Tax=Adineta ricciae TaxID=249248 RepID=A0A814CAL2_ADIRI|nr:unnamed protein product [Adineta ricciae]
MSSVHVKFADDLFSTIVKDEIYEFINLPQISEISFTADASRLQTHQRELQGNYASDRLSEETGREYFDHESMSVEFSN